MLKQIGRGILYVAMFFWLVFYHNMLLITALLFVIIASIAVPIKARVYCNYLALAIFLLMPIIPIDIRYYSSDEIREHIIDMQEGGSVIYGKLDEAGNIRGWALISKR